MYVYGVMRADAWPRLPEEGVAGRAVSRVDHGVLALRAARGNLDAADYQARIAFGERVARAIEAQREAITGRLIVGLDGVSRAAAADEPRHEDMLAAMAFLVDRRRVSAFETAL